MKSRADCKASVTSERFVEKMFRDGDIRAIANAAQDVPKNERVSDKTWDKHYSRLHGLFAYAASNPGAALAIGSTN